MLFQNKAWNFRLQQIPLEEAPLDFTYLQKYLPSSIQVLHVRDGCVTYHLIALGWLEAMISVSLLSKALRSSQATCSRLDMPLLTLRQIGRVVLPEKKDWMLLLQQWVTGRCCIYMFTLPRHVPIYLIFTQFLFDSISLPINSPQSLFNWIFFENHYACDTQIYFSTNLCLPESFYISW